jgi:hypothetical protein
VEAPEEPAGRPSGVAPEPPLEPLRSFLEAHGIPVPRRHGGSRALGIDLLEDLGSRHLDDAVREATAETRRALYRAAVGWVPRLQGLAPDPALPAFSRRMDEALLAYKRDLFLAESVPAALGRPSSPAERDAARTGFAVIAEAVASAPSRLAHRDLQSQNVHVRDDGRLGLVDFQGAFLAPPEYDLVCLLRDSYVELDDAELRALQEQIRPALPDRPPREEFERRFDLLTLSRKGKDHARFLYAARTRGDRRFLGFLPATVRALRAAATRAARRDPAVAGLAELVLALPEHVAAGAAREVPTP